MSFAVDVNVLVDASNVRSSQYGAAQAFLARKAADREIFCVAWMTAMAYLRIVTDPRILGAPLQPADALANVRELLGRANVRMLAEKDDLLDVYGEVVGDQVIRGKLVPDAHLAAILWQHGVRTLYTSDRDFRRFEHLDVRDPFAL